jgi:hypothetical protein
MVFALVLAGAASVLSQSPSSIRTVRRIQVNAQTITALPRSNSYVVDLTQRGVKYEFDPKGGHIDFNRVKVRTVQGEMAIGTFLETKILRGTLVGFKWTSQPFSIRTRPAGTLQTPPAGLPPSANISKAISCGREICTCIGDDSCDEMIDLLPICNETIFCKIDPISRQTVCSCAIRGQF